MKRVSENYAPAKRSQVNISEFRGIDLCNSPTNVSPSRSPQAPNMIRDVPGKVRKRMGYHVVRNYDARINGVFSFFKAGQNSVELVHSGTRLYMDEQEKYSDMADTRSVAWQLDKLLFVSDGNSLVCFDGENVKKASELAFVPKYVIARKPSGGGTGFQSLNLIGDKWSENFLSDGVSVSYQMSFDALDADFVKVEQMMTKDVWVDRVNDTDYRFDPALGSVVFVTAPAKSPIDGADNIRITVKKTRDDYLQKINKCCMSVLFGVSGASDRLFLTGNPDFPNYDWFSEMNDATYFPQTSYCVLGLNTPIVGYSIISDKLAAHKGNDKDDRNIILREGTLTEGKASFPIVNTLQGAGIASGHTIAYLKTEPLFFSRSGIFAIAPSDTNGERYSQNRSFFINNVLEELADKEDSVAVSFRDFYLLAHGKKIYVLDSLMKSYEQGAPYATHQYEAFLLEDIDARVLFVINGALRFGTCDGKIMEFFSDSKNPQSYNDDGRRIDAFWDTPMLSTEAFYSKKTFRYLALKLIAATVTGVRVSVQIKGIWKDLFEESMSFRFLDFGKLNFAKFTFSNDMTPKAHGRKINISKTDKARFRFKNDILNEPFGLYNLAIEFTQNGKIK